MVSLDKIVHLALQGKDDMDSGSCKVTDMLLQKVKILGEGTKYDICVSSSSNRKVSGTDRIGDVAASGICHAYSHDGKCVSMLKTLFTNSCTHECAYCSNASVCSSKNKHYSYTPDELAKVTIALYKRNYIEGLFLSSGIGKDEDYTMEKMLSSIKLLRNKYLFRGYIHLKILPGIEKDNIAMAMQYADRVSVNVEVPSSSYMGELSPTKDYASDILKRQRWIKSLSKKIYLPAGHTTQYVVGGAYESDKEIFSSICGEYGEYNLKRAYFSSFYPVDGTPLESMEAQPSWREHRLYQLDWLFRVYGIDRKELDLIFDENGYINNNDPKRLLASKILEDPIDPNVATYNTLLKIPGIGPVSAQRIIKSRKESPIGSKKDLVKLGVRSSHAIPYLSLNGWHTPSLERWMHA